MELSYSDLRSRGLSSLGPARPDLRLDGGQVPGTGCCEYFILCLPVCWELADLFSHALHVVNVDDMMREPSCQSSVCWRGNVQAISASIRALLSKKSEALPRQEWPSYDQRCDGQIKPGMWHFLFTHLLRTNLRSLLLQNWQRQCSSWRYVVTELSIWAADGVCVRSSRQLRDLEGRIIRSRHVRVLSGHNHKEQDGFLHKLYCRADGPTFTASLAKPFCICPYSMDMLRRCRCQCIHQYRSLNTS